MQERRFLCLAVSRRDAGNCIAGLDIDSGEWLRPIHSADRAAFADSELIVEDNHTHQSRFMAPLDLLSIPLEQSAATNSQPENWVVAPAFLLKLPAILRRCTGKRTAQFLLSHVHRGELLLHSSRDSLHTNEFADRSLSSSLSLVQPIDLAWCVSPHAKHPGKLQVRAEFRLGQTNYNLVVTDPAWEMRCHNLGIGTHKHAECASPECGTVLLTVSLAAVPFHGLHYKLVAGVIELRSFDD